MFNDEQKKWWDCVTGILVISILLMVTLGVSIFLTIKPGPKMPVYIVLGVFGLLVLIYVIIGVVGTQAG